MIALAGFDQPAVRPHPSERSRRSEREVERCTATGLCIRPDPASMAPDETLHRSQSDTSTRKGVRAVQPAKRFEYFICTRGIETNAVVQSQALGG